MAQYSKRHDIPCPPPDNFESGPILPQNKDDVAAEPYKVPWGKDGGHLKDASDAVLESIWGVFEGRRK